MIGCMYVETAVISGHFGSVGGRGGVVVAAAAAARSGRCGGGVQVCEVAKDGRSERNGDQMAKPEEEKRSALGRRKPVASDRDPAHARARAGVA